MDWDKDGDLDLLVGEKYESVHYYQRQEDGSLKEQPIVFKMETPEESTPEVPLKYMSVSADIYDWDNDGIYDIMMGYDRFKSSRAVPIRFYKGKKENGKIVFDKYITFKDTKGMGIQANCGRVEVIDLDGDGNQDLIVGDKKVNVTYYRNVGSNKNPQFETHKLVPNDAFGIPTKPDFKQNGGLGYGMPRFYDWNKDGKLDLLLSGYTSGTILIYLNDGATSAKYTTSQKEQTLKTKIIKNKLSVIVDKNISSQIRIVDSKGIKVYGRKVQKGKKVVHISLKNYVKGVYFVTVTSQNIQRVKKITLY